MDLGRARGTEWLTSAFVYPFAGAGALALPLLAALELVPYGGAVSWAGALAVAILIVRLSARREPAMPFPPFPWSATELSRVYGETLAVAALSMLPLTLFLAVAFTPMREERWLAQGLLMITFVYFWFAPAFVPACLASAALGDGIVDSLTPAHVKRTIKRLGGGYSAILVLSYLGGFFLLIAVGLLQKIPTWGPVVGRLLTLYAEFVMARLLGTALSDPPAAE